jgi:hypothetical protein
MWWGKPKYSLEEVEGIFDMAFDRAQGMYEEARKANMVEVGLLPQEHLSREDMLKNRQRLQLEGQQALGRRIAGTPDDPDLCARDE